MYIATIIISAVIMLFGFAGGGGSSSGGSSSGGSSSSSSSSSYSSSGSSSSSSGGGSSDPISILFSFGVVAIVVVAIVISSKRELVDRTKDYNNTPEEKGLHRQSERIFALYQEDWTNFNLKNIEVYTTDRYYQHASLMLELLQNMHRVNRVSQLNVKKVYLLTELGDNPSYPMRVNIKYRFSGLDEVLDTKSQDVLYRAFAQDTEETWNFVYDGEMLRLDGISQPTESAPHLVKSLTDFANKNSLFYSPDWGRYCLPSRGLIFGGSTMEVADINNHIIGKWDSADDKSAQKGTKPTEKSAGSAQASAYVSSANRGGLLVQLYTYAERPGQAASSYYIVGQINVPKDYLGVIVKSRKFKTKHKPSSDYEKFDLEWNEFNRRYEVYAHSRDALPAFELLNPKFMEFLYDKNPSYNLEVVDNVIYIYAKLAHITEQDYADLLEVLRRANPFL